MQGRHRFLGKEQRTSSWCALVKKGKRVSSRALSTIVSTLIILVSSSLGAGAVALYAIEIGNTMTDRELVVLSETRVWVFLNGTSYAALVIDNVGDRDAVVNSIQIRGIMAPLTRARYLRINTPLTTKIFPPEASVNWNSFMYTDSSFGSFSLGDDMLPLPSGMTVVIYIAEPDRIALRDIGTTIVLTVHSANAQYYSECNVQAIL
jgi:hypothetical protein